jgi:hypothetical protein
LHADTRIAAPNNRFERSQVASSLGQGGVDDWDKVPSFDAGEAPRRSTSSLCDKGDGSAMISPPRPPREVLREWAPELSRKLQRPADQILSEGLSADDFSIGQSVDVRLPDGTLLVSYKFAFSVVRPEYRKAAVFSEHDGYIEFDLVEDAVVAEIHEDVYRQR